MSVSRNTVHVAPVLTLIHLSEGVKHFRKITISVPALFTFFALFTIVTAVIVFTLTEPSTVNVILPPSLQLSQVSSLTSSCSTGTVLTSIPWGTKGQGSASSIFVCLTNNGGVTLYVNPTDLSSTLASAIGAVSWSLAAQVQINTASQVGPYSLTLTLSSTATLGSASFNIVINACDTTTVC